MAIAAGCGLAFPYTAGRRFIDWIFAIPLVLFTDASPSEALAESTRITHPHRKELIKMLIRWLIVSAFLFLALGLIMFTLKWALLGLAGKHVGLVLSMTAILAVLQFIAAGLVTSATSSMRSSYSAIGMTTATFPPSASVINYVFIIFMAEM